MFVFLFFKQKTAYEMRISDWSSDVCSSDLNVTALVSITRKLLPALIARKGAIINLASVAGSYPYPGGNVYAGTKAFVHQFSLAIRSDLDRKSTRLNSSH